MTAAHKSLPLPTYVQVTNLKNNRQLILRVNDRGPFHADRVIDLSYAAAVKLGFAGSGTAPVRVEVLEPKRDYYLQAGAFSSLDAADKLKYQVQRLTGHSAFVVKVPGDDLYRVRIGPVQNRKEAELVQSSISAAALPEPSILPL